MRKHFARAANLVCKIAKFLVPVLTVIKLIVEIANKVANCNVRKLQIQITAVRQFYRGHSLTY